MIRQRLLASLSRPLCLHNPARIKIILLRNGRFASTSANSNHVDFQNHQHDLHQLEAQIKNHILESESPVSEQTVLSALQACTTLEATFAESSKADNPLPETPVEEARKLLRGILESKNVKLTTDMLKKYFIGPSPSIAPSSTSSIEVLTAYNKQLGTTYIPREVSIIPFRRAAYNAEFDNSLAIMDATVGTKSLYHRYIRKQMRKYGLYWVGATGSILASIEALLRSGLVGDWPSTAMVQVMAFTYLSSISIYGVLSSAGRVSGAGEVLEWVGGTPSTYRYSHAAEMKMASILAGMNSALPENQGECSLHMIKQLLARRMQPIEPEQETMMKEYWARGGEGFEWIEPDQDPAEIIWRQKMELAKASRIGSPYTRKYSNPGDWTDEVLHSIPHASLIDTGDKSLPAPSQAPSA
ncbi:hypothetical protein AWJ20_5234 [Sugiyamaella lignohabitans]|uniref:Uncharacterized protein n=1 Tax=Sugiyamaella lignohabitans TaxID=796027 RepID=A0A167EMZ7_9ASCO|nr:uncharacterized protein AWJ20_5234 [Sugiyamaella lignohabitans]ANB14269.1 hypothetical protein AWJ20_5234 [Sugiyamaella lignohabitans]